MSQQSDRELAEARRVLVDNQNGGRHRRARSIGQGSAQEKMKTWKTRAKYFVGAIAAIFVSASLAGIILDG
ncbi:MAG: hypothetical protein AAF692_01265, partial [Pseudomonadota bacterium]